MKDNINENSYETAWQKLEERENQLAPQEGDSLLTYYSKGFRYHLENFLHFNLIYNDTDCYYMLGSSVLAASFGGITLANIINNSHLLSTPIATICGTAAFLSTTLATGLFFNLKSNYPSFRENYSEDPNLDE